MKRLWTAATARLLEVPLPVVERVMHRRGRPAGWRYHIWFAAWCVALISALPLEIALGLLLAHVELDEDVAYPLLLVLPVVLGGLSLYAYVRQVLGPPIPPSVLVGGEVD